MLLEDMVVEGVSAFGNCGAELDDGPVVPSSTWDPDNVRGTADMDEGRGAVDCDVQEGPDGDALIEEGRERMFAEDGRVLADDGSAVADSGLVVVLGTSVVCTTPCTNTKVPGGGKLRGGTATGGAGIVGWTLDCVDSAGGSCTGFEGFESSTMGAVWTGGEASSSCSIMDSEVSDKPSL